MSTTTFYPNKDGDSSPTSVDGYFRNDESGGGGASWADIRTRDPGTAAFDDHNSLRAMIKAGSSNWSEFQRSILGFDKSSIDGENIASATLDLVCIFNNDTYTDSCSLVDAAPLSNTALVVADYDHLGTTKQAADRPFDEITNDSATHESFTLNATGLTRIGGNGVINFGLRTKRDNDDDEPTISSGQDDTIRFASADEALASDKRPRLVITHTSAFTPRAIMF